MWLIYKYAYSILHLFQRDFYVAVSSLLENGIYQKIEKDITTSKQYRGLFDIYWVPERLRTDKPLTIDHVIPAFFLLGLLIPSTFVFFLELIHPLCKKKNAGKKSDLDQRTISKEDVDNNEYGKDERGGWITLKFYFIFFKQNIDIEDNESHSYQKIEAMKSKNRGPSAGNDTTTPQDESVNTEVQQDIMVAGTDIMTYS